MTTVLEKLTIFDVSKTGVDPAVKTQQNSSCLPLHSMEVSACPYVADDGWEPPTVFSAVYEKVLHTRSRRRSCFFYTLSGRVRSSEINPEHVSFDHQAVANPGANFGREGLEGWSLPHHCLRTVSGYVFSIGALIFRGGWDPTPLLYLPPGMICRRLSMGWLD